MSLFVYNFIHECVFDCLCDIAFQCVCVIVMMLITEHMRVGRIAITQPLGTVMPLYHTRGGRIHLCVYLCEVPQCIRNI